MVTIFRKLTSEKSKFALKNFPREINTDFPQDCRGKQISLSLVYFVNNSAHHHNTINHVYFCTSIIDSRQVPLCACVAWKDRSDEKEKKREKHPTNV